LIKKLTEAELRGFFLTLKLANPVSLCLWSPIYVLEVGKQNCDFVCPLFAKNIMLSVHFLGA